MQTSLVGQFHFSSINSHYKPVHAEVVGGVCIGKLISDVNIFIKKFFDDDIFS